MANDLSVLLTDKGFIHYNNYEYLAESLIMSEKKFLLTVILALILAILILLLIFKIGISPKTEENLPAVEHALELQPAEDDSSEVSSSDEAVQETAQETLKKEENPPAKAEPKAVKPAAKPAVKPAVQNKQTPQQPNDEKTLSGEVEEKFVAPDVYKDKDGNIIVNRHFSFKSRAKYLFK